MDALVAMAAFGQWITATIEFVHSMHTWHAQA